MIRRRPLIVATLVLLLVVLGGFWTVFFSQTASSALTRVPLLDEAWYLRDAERVRETGWPGDQPFVMSPGYTTVVAASGAAAPDADGVVARTGAGLLAIQLAAWLLLGAVPAAVVWRIGRRWNRRPGVVIAAAALAAALPWLHPPVAVYARTVLPDLLLAALVALTVALIGWRPSDRPGAWMTVTTGAIALGLAAALRAHVIVLVVPLGWWLATAPARTGGRRARLVAPALLLLALVPVLLAAVHNTRTGGSLAGPSLNGGLNLYLGQQTAAGGLFTVLAGFDQAHEPSGERYLERRLGRELAGPAAADRAWFGEARRLMAEHPLATTWHWLRKVWLHLQGWSMAQVTPLSRWPQEAPVLRALPVPWWLLVVLGASGAALAIRERDAWPWLGTLLALLAVQSLFFVVARYRLVLVPSLAVLAGLGLLVLAERIGRRGWRAQLPWLAAPALAALVTVPWGLTDARQTWQGLEAHNLARRLSILAGDAPAPELRRRADALYAVACRTMTRQTEPWRERARNLAALDDRDAALEVLAEATMVVDDPRPLRVDRIALVRDAGRLPEAEALMAAYLRDHPDDLDMRHDLAVLQGQRGRWPSVAATAAELRRLAPGDARGWLDGAVAATRMGRREQAVALLEQGLRAVDDEVQRQLLATNLERLRR
jgi:4-amino-4-deoxy-L-arabinose transferase-like glycosyltransferase